MYLRLCREAHFCKDSQRTPLEVLAKVILLWKVYGATTESIMTNNSDYQDLFSKLFIRGINPQVLVGADHEALVIKGVTW